MAETLVRKLVLITCAGALVGGGCGKPATTPGQASLNADQVATATAAAPSPAGKSESKSDTPHAGPSAPMLAYAYRYSIETPADAVASLLHRHEAACRDAGSAFCQVVGASSDSEGRDRATGMLELRAEPRWLAGFRARLDGDARSVGGRILKSGIATEDLTRQIIDTDAGIRARTLLRGRLEQLLATRPGKLSELIELEQELARVQGEIDAAQSEVAVMRTRVAMSTVTLGYDSRPPLSEPGALRPLHEAARGFVGNFAQSLAAIINLIAVLLPFGAVVALGTWGVLRWRRRLPVRSQAIIGTRSDPPLSQPVPPLSGA